jgi:hypothetical protein
MNPSHRRTPRALHKAKLWTAGVLTASTVLVGAVGVHLAEAQAQTVAAQTVSQASSSSAGSGTTDSSSSGFAAVAPLSGSAVGAQSSSGGS